MLSWMREKFGPVLIGIIIGFIAFVFVFYGVFNPKATRGLHEGAVAGIVNGEPISIAEFSRELNRRMEFFKNLGGGKISEQQLKAFRMHEMVFGELVNRKLLGQAAVKNGMVASDEEVRQKIAEMPVFQKNGKFDTETYKQVLLANNYNPAGFERMVRDDLSMQAWNHYFRDRVRVSDEEIRREFMTSKDRRNIKYALITTEAARRGIAVDPAAVQKFLADPAKVELARTQWEQKKNREYKGLTFDLAKEQIARDLLAGEKTDEALKIVDRLADQILGMMTAAKGNDAKINALLKPFNVEVRSTGLISRQNPFVPGIGEAKDLLADAFAKKSPIDPQQGGKAKKYTTATWRMVALVTESQSPDPSKLESERAQILNQIVFRKERELFEAWMKKLHSQAKIEKNKSVVTDDEEGKS